MLNTIYLAMTADGILNSYNILDDDGALSEEPFELHLERFAHSFTLYNTVLTSSHSILSTEQLHSELRSNYF